MTNSTQITSESAGQVFYTYEYWNPNTNMPMYVGKGSHLRHLDQINKTCKIAGLAHELMEIIESGNKPRIVRTWFDTEEEAFEYEMALIAKYGRRNKGTGSLWNKSKGGPGVGGDFNWSDDAKTKLAEKKASKEYQEHYLLGMESRKQRQRAGWSLERIAAADKRNEYQRRQRNGAK